ncbi:ABC transporter substrate-binding protein [Terasakiella sp. A23]|uniref:MlaC/ttg2D family ABC transporter substrate-binding protein n=1 Tax=Terasakiella sp. FCG-A23 TaxID=3080561 RepID=UPI002953FEAC|nr:ABC transporter substrate-binding protein [Terasakiella sp. A23]MDV7338929.1 ABC transporter substrate-binding protein [Terasakiella sp. A23]
MMTRRFFSIAVLALGIAIASTTVHASDFGKRAETFVQTMSDKAMASFRNAKDSETQQIEFRTLLNEGFDVRAIGKWVLGRYWRKATKEEKEEYLDLFEDFIIVTYSKRFADYSGDDIKLTVVQSLTKNDKDAIVRSQIEREQAGEPIMVDWRVKSNKSGELKIVDVLIAGVSMSQTQRAEFTSVIKQNGGKVQDLIDALKNKTDQLVNKVDAAAN